jgi:hypothetical protein
LRKRLAFIGLLAVTLALGIVACSEQQRAALQAMAAVPTSGNGGAPTAVASALPSDTPAFSMLATATLDPIAAGPMGTWTAIALTIAPPTIDAEPYVIVNRGNPHYIEFHAWW